MTGRYLQIFKHIEYLWMFVDDKPVQFEHYRQVRSIGVSVLADNNMIWKEK